MRLCTIKNDCVVLMILVIFLVGVRCHRRNDLLDEVLSVVKGVARLPCNITPPTEDDGLRLVLWYKNNNPQPVYSYDARFSTVKHWSEDSNLAPRSKFQVGPGRNASLEISNVDKSDQGVYKCRVDFRTSATKVFKMKLVVIEEPGKPLILDEEGSAVMGTLGPYKLGKALILVCIVEGGNPLPSVIWTRNGHLYDQEQDPPTYHDTQQNTCVIPSLDRSYHDNTFTCIAQNNNVTQSLTSSVIIKLEMPAESIMISNLPDPVVAQKNYEATCQVIGAQPVPEVTWYLENDVILDPSGDTTTRVTNNLISSTLNFTPQIKDGGKTLSCVAENKVEKVNKSLTLNVYYLPIVNLDVNKDLQKGLREGDDLTLKCKVDSHPWVWRILWYKDGLELFDDDDDNIEILDQEIHLRNLTKNANGQYLCSATNVEGDGFSQPLLINIQYKPTCSESIIEKKNSGDVYLACRVDSKPIPNSYRWLFNSSDTNFEIPSAESSMTFRNAVESDEQNHGQVSCWASNDIGEQIEPCVFYVVPLGPPHPPKNCQIKNHTESVIQVGCDSGFNGGISQYFLVQVFETTLNNSQILVASNWTDDISNVDLWGLTPESNYIISIKSVNNKGESTPVYIGGKTEGFIHYSPSVKQGRLPLLFIIIGILVALMFIGACITISLALKRKKFNQREQHRLNNNQKKNGEREEEEGEKETLLLQRHKQTIATAGSPPETKVVKFHECSCNKRRQNDTRRPPIQRTIVKTFSVEKRRPICPVCNPSGNTPYPKNEK